MQVYFHILSVKTAAERALYVCGLIEKYYQKGAKILVLCPSNESVQLYDDLLWTYRADSFLPHVVTQSVPVPAFENKREANTVTDPLNTIYLSCSIMTACTIDVVFNVTDACLPVLLSAQYVIEVLYDDQAVKEKGRARYRHYKAEKRKIFTQNV